jgi:hypothetical protein
MTEILFSDAQQYYFDRGKSTGDFHGQVPMLWFAYSLLADYR